MECSSLEISIQQSKNLLNQSLNKKELEEYSEAKIMKTFKTKVATSFIKGNLIYNLKDKIFFKVLDLKTDDSNKPTWVSLVSNDGNNKREISSETEFSEYQDFIDINVVISPATKEKQVLLSRVKIYEKLETALESAFLGVGAQIIAFKLFYKGKTLDKAQCPAQILEINDGDYIYAPEGLGKPSVYKRFKSVYTQYGWSNSGSYPDGIAFIPTQNIKVCGFSCFAARTKDKYEMRYRVRINGTDVEDETITATGWEDEHYFRRRLNGVYDAPSGTKIEFTCWIAENLQSHSYVETFYGNDGYEYDQIENEHMGLFKIDSGGESSNGTSVYSGHFGINSKNIQSSEVNEVIDGSILLHITNDFLKSIKNDLITVIIESFRPQNSTLSGAQNLGLFNMTYDLTGITVNTIQFDAVNSKIMFQAEKPNILTELVNLQMDMVFDFSIKAQPEFYVDEGNARISFCFNKTSVGLGMINLNGVYQFTVEDVSAVYCGSNSYFNGTGDLSFVLNKATQVLNGIMAQNINKTVEQVVSFLIPMINGQIANLGTSKNIPGTNLTINYAAMSSPIFTNNSLTLVLNGETTSSNRTIPFQDKRKIDYAIDDKGRTLQISLGDYLFNSTLYSAYMENMIHFDIRSLSGNETSDPITASTFKLLFPGITKYMPADRKISIMLIAEKDFVPSLELKNNETDIRMVATINFAELDDQGNRLEFISFKANVTIQAAVTIQNPFQVKVDIRQLKIKATELTLDKYSLTNLPDLNSMVGILSGVIRNYLNIQYSGYKPQWIDLGLVQVDFNNTKLSELDHYFFLESTPEFKKKVGFEINNKPMPIFDNKPMTYQDKVDAVAALLKLTPIYQSLLDLKKNEDVLRSINNLAPFGGGNFYREGEKDDLPKERACSDEKKSMQNVQE